ncbi:unannotated protein [freshwater metagenome]|uniref:Unannotated protein n=1 Tax=freshwater metagenome TaxID=449393 RepID=A0A6J6CPX4_9ZZZZ
MRVRHHVGAVLAAVIETHGQNGAAREVPVIGQLPVSGRVEEEIRLGHDGDLGAPVSGLLSHVKRPHGGIFRDLHGDAQPALADGRSRAHERLAVSVEQPGALAAGAGEHHAGHTHADVVFDEAFDRGDIDPARGVERSRGGGPDAASELDFFHAKIGGV